MGRELDRLLEQYASKISTRRVVVERALPSRLPGLLRDAFPDAPPLLLVADANTWEAAGDAVAATLAASGISTDRLILEPQANENKVHPDESHVNTVADRLRETGRTALAVGAGTINDLAKMASFRLERPYVVVATAPSMNGYTSAIAAIVVDGLKKTLAARGPRLIAADTDVLARAPDRMIGAGYADMVAKWVASADWRLADRLLGSGYDPRVERVSRAAIDLLLGEEPAIGQRRPESVAKLMDALSISGLSMAIAGSSAHISGAEHLFSHYIDMMVPDVADRELHGRQAGIGTLCSAAIYEALLTWSPDQLDVDERVAKQPPWDVRRTQIEEHFGKVAPAVLEEAKAVHAEGESLRERLTHLIDVWSALRPEIAEAVAPRAAIESRMREAGAPFHFADLGITGPQMREILTWSKDIRARYTVLHLAADLGLLESCVERAIAAFSDAS